MISSQKLLALLQREGVCFFTGVPDSLLQPFCAELARSLPAEGHIIAANEGSAVGLAAGYHLASGKIGCVYLQNSGLGNAINPLVSLVDPDVYSIPIFLVVGWRGELIDGTQICDEPQHSKQGKITLEMLDCLEIPYAVVGAETEDFDSVVVALVSRMHTEARPVALVIRRDSFVPATNKPMQASYELTREAALNAIADVTPDEVIVVSTTGKTSRELYEIRVARGYAPERDFLTVGSMGHALQIAIGISVARPDRKVMCIDGDGALLMHMGGLATAAKRRNLIHVVINNGAHDSVGGQPTMGFDIDMLGVARACGYSGTRCVTSAEDIRSTIRDFLSADGAGFLEIRTQCGARTDLGRPKNSPIQAKLGFMRTLGLRS